jgi:type III polyketide synthase
VFELVEWGTNSIPDTIEHLSFYADIEGTFVVSSSISRKDLRSVTCTNIWINTHTGYRTVLSRDVATYTNNAIKPMFERLLLPYKEQINPGPGAGEELQMSLGPGDFDWALHPGGQAIIKGAQQVLQLTDDQLQASREIYRTRGNSSSATVLIVLDRLRTLGKREHIVATSFGPGMTIEMAMLRRCETLE